MKHVAWIFIIIALGGMLGFCLVGALKPLICKVYTWDHPDGKIVRCLRVGSDVRGGQPEPEATATYEYPTYEPPTATSWEPWSTPTRTGTVEPYPEPATATPGEPYP
jgi:hypothetical protein